MKRNFLLKGIMDDWNNSKLFLDGEELDPKPSQEIKNHSPTGFSWGYTGSGPSQSALAICLELYGEKLATLVYREFYFRYIVKLPQTDFEMVVATSDDWEKFVNSRKLLL